MLVLSIEELEFSIEYYTTHAVQLIVDAIKIHKIPIQTSKGMQGLDQITGLSIFVLKDISKGRRPVLQDAIKIVKSLT
jgi:hypothetical protein